MRSWTLLAESIAKLKSKDWRFHCVGSGRLQQQVVEQLRSAAGKRLVVHGRVEGDALYALLSQSDLFVWPAINEAMGMALLEAQGCGTAVLAQRRGGVANVVCHGVSGYLTPTRDATAFASAIDYLLNRPLTLRRMGDAGSHIVRARHSLEAAGARLTQLLESVCAT